MKNRVAQMKPSDFSLGQMYEFAAEFGRQGGNPDLLQFLIENKARMVSVVALARGNDLPKGYALSRLILGDDFISPEDVASAYGFSYTKDQLAQFASTLPEEKTIQWLRTNGYMLVAGPTTDLNLLGVRALDRSLFYRKNDGDSWFEDEKHTFSRTDMVRGGQWLMLRKGDVPNSRSKNWKEQASLVTSPEYVPNVAEASYGITVYRKVRGVYLLSDFYVRTSYVDADGVRVIVGYFDEQGLGVYDYWDGHRDVDLGVSSARN
jgi:hypothetical protein